jgi:hypothetical protein
MSMTPVPAVTLTPIAYFPEKYFLENLAVRADGSVLITAVLQKELWCVPSPEPRAEVRPVLVHTFEHMISGIVEVFPERIRRLCFRCLREPRIPFTPCRFHRLDAW